MTAIIKVMVVTLLIVTYSCSIREETVFYCDEFPRPLGFICTDPYSGEGYLMQF